ncbi:hypothetical protein ACFE04_022367 [Oxalis oulophora]
MGKMQLRFVAVLVFVLLIDCSSSLHIVKPDHVSNAKIIKETKLGTQQNVVLSTSHYAKSCPTVEAIIQQRMNVWYKLDPTLAPSVLRLHFHDCVVRGCDASILLNTPGTERKAKASKNLRGFDVIDDIKRELEKQCPKTVSCADILTAAARDATLLLNGPFWEVPYGRKDGKISLSNEAETIVPQGHEDVTKLINLFQTLGLNVLDLVTLSGAHTIGRSSCSAFLNRLAYFNGTTKPDKSLDYKYWNELRKACTKSYNFVELDVITPKKFDTQYYTNLKMKKGLLSTDQLLYSDIRTNPYVETMATEAQLFSDMFSASMVNLGNVQGKNSNQGEIRLNCNFVNKPIR